jgi:hypothetical protein
LLQRYAGQVAGQITNTLRNTRVRWPRVCYSYCMISPIRGNFTGIRVQVPPRTRQNPITACLRACGIVTRAQPAAAAGDVPLSGLLSAICVSGLVSGRSRWSQRCLRCIAGSAGLGRRRALPPSTFSDGWCVACTLPLPVCPIVTRRIARRPCDHELCGRPRIRSPSTASLVRARQELFPVRCCGSGWGKRRG